MDLDELRSVRRTEREKDSLQHLRDSFYEDVATYIQERKAERRRAAEGADDPFGDPEVGRLTDEINTAEDVVEAIYERRVGKVVKLASFAAADMSADKTGLTAEERTLFDDLVARIKQNRQTVLDTLTGERDETGGSAGATDVGDDGVTDPPTTGDDVTAPDAAAASPPDDPTSPDDSPTPDDVLAAAMGGDADRSTAAPAGDATSPAAPDPDSRGAANDLEPAAGTGDDPSVTDDESADDASDTSRSDRVTIRITEDVGRIYGVDEREYDLASEDVVTLPATNAGPLMDRGAAERLE